MTTWYLAKDDRRHVRQVVIETDESAAQASRFGDLMMSGQYKMLCSLSWTTGYFRLDDDPGPYLLARADGQTEHLRSGPFRVAFTFYREPAGGLFGLFVGADSEALRKASPTANPVIESLSGLDVQEVVDRIRDALAKETVHVCFAEAAQGLSMDAIGADGKFHKMSPPGCRFDRIISVPEDCRKALSAEFQGLLAHHRSLAVGARNFQRSAAQLDAEFPQSENPVLDYKYATATAKANVLTRPSFWKRLFG
jgi:hypothetical protein